MFAVSDGIEQTSVVGGTVDGNLASLAVVSGTLGDLTLAPGGRMLAGAGLGRRSWPVRSLGSRVIVWRVGPQGKLRFGGASRQLAGEGRWASDSQPRWSPDGARVLFLRTLFGLDAPEDASREIWSLDPSTWKEELLASELGLYDLWTLSPDSSQAYVASGKVIRAYPAGPRSASAGPAKDCVVSVPGEVVALAGLAGGKVVAVIFPSSGEQPAELPPGTFQIPGRRDACAGARVVVADVRSGSWRAVAEGALGACVATGPDGRTVVFTDVSLVKGRWYTRIRTVSADGGLPSTVAHCPGKPALRWLQPAPGGRFVFVTDGVYAFVYPPGRLMLDANQTPRAAE